MKNLILTLACIFSLYADTLGQIIFRGCTSVLGDQNYALYLTGTTNDGGIIRNTYESMPADFTQSCPAGVCELRIIWNVTLDRWEIKLDNDGPLGNPDYTTADMYYNTSPSAPFPPDLTLGAWVDAGFCPSAISTLTGEVQNYILPVSMLYFKANRNAGETKLIWQTVSEVNNKIFEIEESLDGVIFDKIGEVEGKGTTSISQSYSFIVKNIRHTLTYYRLKQIDMDGRFEYSEMVSVSNKITREQESTFYPNPSQSKQANLKYYAETEGELKVSVFNITGTLITIQRHLVSAGYNDLGFDFTSLKSGAYLIKTESKTGSEFHKIFLE